MVVSRYERYLFENYPYARNVHSRVIFRLSGCGILDVMHLEGRYDFDLLICKECSLNWICRKMFRSGDLFEG